MIDTVGFVRRATFKQIAKGWKQTSSKFRFPNGFLKTTRKLSHQQTGLKIIFDPSRNEALVEVSLPRMIFPSNARLIRSQRKLDLAMERVDLLVQEVATPLVNIPSKRFVRVDLVWQVLGKIDDFIFAHRHLPHPAKSRGRNLPVIYGQETILWPGNEISLSIYDKEKEMKIAKGSGKIVRIELRLLGKKVSELLGRRKTVTKLKLDRAYETFRDVLLKFHPKAVPKLSNTVDIYKAAVRESWKINGFPAFDLLISSLSDKRRREAIKRVQNVQLREKQINWKHLLPRKFPTLFYLRKNQLTYYRKKKAPPRTSK